MAFCVLAPLKGELARAQRATEGSRTMRAGSCRGSLPLKEGAPKGRKIEFLLSPLLKEGAPKGREIECAEGA